VPGVPGVPGVLGVPAEPVARVASAEDAPAGSAARAEALGEDPLGGVAGGHEEPGGVLDEAVRSTDEGRAAGEGERGEEFRTEPSGRG
jgi:hypothetical protein